MGESKSPSKLDAGLPLVSKSNQQGRVRATTNRSTNMTNPRRNNFAPKPSKFEGKTDDIKGDIYDTPDGCHADLFNKTTKAISDYIQRTYTNGMACSLSVRTMTKAVFDLPNDPGPTTDTVTKAIFDEEVKQYVKHRHSYKNSMVNVYGIIMGQCTNSMVAAIESHKLYETFYKTENAIGLLKAIKEISYTSKSHRYEPLQMYENKRKFFMTYQKHHITCQAYFEEFKTQIEIITRLGGNVCGDDLTNWMLKKKGTNPNLATPEMSQEAIEAGQDAFEAVAFLSGGADKTTRYGKMIEELKNDQIKRLDSFLKTLVEAYNYLTRWKNDPRNMMRSEPSNDGVNFATTGDKDKEASPNNAKATMATTGKQRQLKCFICGSTDHLAPKCPDRHTNDANQDNKDKDKATKNGTGQEATAVKLLTSGMELLNQAVKKNEMEELSSFGFCTVHGTVHTTTSSGILPTWILLDKNQSTVDVFCNASLLRNIRHVDTVMNIHSQSRVSTTNTMGTLHGYGDVWYNPHGIANILSLSNVKRMYRVTFDSGADDCFVVNKDTDGTQRIFHPMPNGRGLYYMDTATKDSHNFVVTVADKKENYSKQDYQQVSLARRIHDMIGRPSIRDYLHIVQNNLLPNCPVSFQDVKAAQDIFGPNLGSLKGKTTQKRDNTYASRTVSPYH